VERARRDDLGVLVQKSDGFVGRVGLGPDQARRSDVAGVGVVDIDGLSLLFGRHGGDVASHVRPVWSACESDGLVSASIVNSIGAGDPYTLPDGVTTVNPQEARS